MPAVELAEGGRIVFGAIDLEVLHTPGHTEGSVCLLARESGVLLSGDTLFAGAWGRTDLTGGSEAAMAESLARLARLDPSLSVLPGHGATTTIERERSWLDLVAQAGAPVRLTIDAASRVAPAVPVGACRWATRRSPYVPFVGRPIAFSYTAPLRSTTKPHEV